MFNFFRKKEPKYCEDCKYFQLKERPFCLHDKNHVVRQFSPEYPYRTSCHDSRSTDHLCGPEAKFFVKREDVT